MIALGGAVLADQEHRSHEETFAIFFSVIAAANGYLFAMAIGDFGRSIVAIPLGAFSGYAAVTLFSYPMPNIVFISVLFFIALLSLTARMMKVLSGCLSMVVLFFAFFAFLGAVKNGRFMPSGDPEMALFCSYPFVCGCVAASMPIENSPSAIWDAWLAGVRAAMHGMVMGGLASIAVGILILISASIFSSSRRDEEFFAIAFAVISLSLANYFCVQNIFTAVHRAERAPVKIEEQLMAEKEKEVLPEKERSDE
jgi:hypothetical protein